jgi:hypothetical protein
LNGEAGYVAIVTVRYSLFRSQRWLPCPVLPSARLFLRGFRLRPLISLVLPFHELILFIAIPFLDFADKLLVVPSDLLQVIIDELAILLFQFAFELHPFPLELIRIHGFLLLCEMALPHSS